MTRLLAYFLTVLLLLQSFGRELLVLNFAVNRASITQKYCVNKARPSLRCNGKLLPGAAAAPGRKRASQSPGLAALGLR